MGKETDAGGISERSLTGREKNVLRMRAAYRRTVRPFTERVIRETPDVSQALTTLREEQRMLFLNLIDDYASIAMYGRIQHEQPFSGSDVNGKYKKVDPLKEEYSIKLQEAGFEDVKGSIRLIQDASYKVNELFMEH